MNKASDLLVWTGSLIQNHSVSFFTLCLNKAWHERQQTSYLKLYNMCKFLFIDQWTWLPGVEGLPDPESAHVGRKHSVCEWTQYEQDSVITFNEGRCWCGVLPLLEQRKDDTHTHSGEWGHWRPYPEDGQRSGADKERKTERTIECNTMEQTDDASWWLEASTMNTKCSLTNKSAVNAVKLQLR